jgi:hypothetical protein
MCEPTTILAIVSAASAAVGTYAQGQQAKATQNALDKQRAAQAEETAAQRDQAIGERVAAARREAGRRLVAAGEAGVAGASTGLGITDAFSRANQDAAMIAKQAAFNDRASEAAYRSNVAQIDKPNIVDSGLAIVQGYNSGRELGRRLTIGSRQYSGASTSPTLDTRGLA